MLQKLACMHRHQKSGKGWRDGSVGKGLSCKHEDASSYLQYPSMQSITHLQSQKGDANEKEDKEEEEEEEVEQKAQGKEGKDKERRQRTPGAQWPSNSGKLMSSRVSERLSQKRRSIVSEEDHRHCPLACTCVHRCISFLYMRTHNQTTLTHTCTQSQQAQVFHET